MVQIFCNSEKKKIQSVSKLFFKGKNHMDIDPTTYQLLSDTRCGICSNRVGVGIQCSLCHKWFHINPASSSSSSSSNNMASSIEANARLSPQQTFGSATSSSYSHFPHTLSNSSQQSQSNFMMGSAQQSSHGTASPHYYLTSNLSATGGSIYHPHLRPAMQAQQRNFMRQASNFQQQQQQQNQNNVKSPTQLKRKESSSSNNNNQNNQGGYFYCHGVDFPKYFPYFCQDCALRCSSVQMPQVTEIFIRLLQDEKDEVASGAPVIFGTVTASFVRKRIRAIGKGDPQYAEKRFIAKERGETVVGVDEDDYDISGENDHQQQQNNNNMDLPEIQTDEEKRSCQRLQKQWENLFSRQTLAVIRRVLAVIFPEVFDDSAIVKATKAARAGKKFSQQQQVQAAQLIAQIQQQQKDAAELGSLASPTENFFSGDFGASMLPPTGNPQEDAKRRQYLQNKFLSPITFVAPNLTAEDYEGNDYLAEAYYYQKNRPGQEDFDSDDDEEQEEQQSEESKAISEAEAKARQTQIMYHIQQLRNANKRKIQARDQDIDLMDMQHEVTLHRLRWMPHRMSRHQLFLTSTSNTTQGDHVNFGSGLKGKGNRSGLTTEKVVVGPDHQHQHQAAAFMDEDEREVFGPQPVYVNPITSQIRLSEVVIEVGANSKNFNNSAASTGVFFRK
jgi:hypothetical protein